MMCAILVCWGIKNNNGLTNNNVFVTITGWKVHIEHIITTTCILHLCTCTQAAAVHEHSQPLSHLSVVTGVPKHLDHNVQR